MPSIKHLSKSNFHPQGVDRGCKADESATTTHRCHTVLLEKNNS